MAHSKLIFSRRKIDLAGEFLSKQNGEDQQSAVDNAIDALNNWRSFHSFPLNTITADLKQKVGRVQSGAHVVRRLKRSRSMIAKLKKESSMRLTQMQDVGGCRAVVGDIDAVYRLKDLYLRGRSQHELISIDDYIRSPKPSGYRSLHLVFRFKSKGYPEYNKLLLEVQLRTITQHAWATAVETVGAVSGQALKSSEGEGEWLEYFQFASLALEHSEHPVFSTIVPHSLGTIARKLSELGRKLQVKRKLTAYREALRTTDKVNANNASYFLLVLLPEQPQLKIFSYSRQDTEQAFKDYEKFERLLPLNSTRKQLPLFPDLENYTGAQAVLVGAESFKSIRESYPNYYLDTKVFLEKIDSFVKRYRRAI
jgi:hypothetical protein